MKKDHRNISVDQCRAIAECLLPNPDTAERGRMFEEMAKTAEREDWPSSPIAAAVLLTKEEARAISMADRELYQRVFAPYLTQTELDRLQRESEAAQAYGRKFFSENP